jgi:sec-independent protein translocase protein TatB
MIQGGEWLVILLLALIVFGPERLPELSRKLGGWVREMRNAAREMREGLEAEIGDLESARKEVSAPITEVKETLRDAARLAKENDPTRLSWNGPKPVSGPTPEQALADLDRIEEGLPPAEGEA